MSSPRWVGGPTAGVGCVQCVRGQWRLRFGLADERSGFSGGLRDLMRVGEKVGLEDCKVLGGVELTLYGVKDLWEYA